MNNTRHNDPLKGKFQNIACMFIMTLSGTVIVELAGVSVIRGNFFIWQVIALHTSTIEANHN